ncbi:MAG: hypothetical protein U5L75_01865 [Candidatus Campbellbacteria bacterium]|nr:hypothetical protein [Candidatus Campbellbacteria bacterium]
MFENMNSEGENRSTPELDNLLKQREEVTRRLYVMMFENLAIFGVPAFVALVVGLKLREEWGNIALFALLALALVVSWLIFFRRYRYFTGELAKLETAIKNERKRAGIPEPEAPGYPDEEEEESDEEKEEE